MEHLHYQSTRACDRCGATRLCLWHPRAPFTGVWLCGPCGSDPGEDLADVVKAVWRATAHLPEPPAQR